jgi:hypothetical protein
MNSSRTHGHGRDARIWVVEGPGVGSKVRLESARHSVIEIMFEDSGINAAGSDLRREDRCCGETLHQQGVLYRIWRGNVIPSIVVRDETFQIENRSKKVNWRELGECERVLVLVERF